MLRIEAVADAAEGCEGGCGGGEEASRYLQICYNLLARQHIGF